MLCFGVYHAAGNQSAKGYPLADCRAAELVVDAIIERNGMRTAWCIVAFLLLWTAAFARADETDETIEVVVVGMGKDSDQALKNALRAAVRQAVGGIVDSKTLVENDEVISDRILSHSGGYVEKYDVLGEPKSEDGLVSIQIKAKVKALELREKLESEKITLASFDGSNYSAEAFTRRLQEESAVEILEEVLAGFPKEYMTVKMVGEPVVNDKKDKLTVKVEVGLDADKAKSLIKQLDAFLRTAAEVKTLRLKVSKERSGFSVTPSVAISNNIVLLTSVNAARTNGIAKAYPLTKEMKEFMAKRYHERDPYVTIDLLDKDGEIMAGNHYKIPLPHKFGSDRFIFLPFLTDNSASYSDFRPATATAQLSYSFDVNAEELAEIANVKMEITMD